MIDPLFVQPSAIPEFHQDFWRLVELSGFGIVPANAAHLAKSGFQIWPTLDEEFMETMERNPKGKRGWKAIFWNLERPDGTYMGKGDIWELFTKGIGEILGWADAVWVIDRTLATMDLRCLFAPIGGHPGLRTHGPMPSEYDVIHIGQETPRRRLVLEGLRERGIKLSGNAWGEERERKLASSELMLAVDRIGKLRVGSPLRWVLAAAYGIPIVSEELDHPFPLEPGRTILTAPYDRLADFVMETLERDDLEALGAATKRVLCEEWTFRRCVMNALENMS